MSSRVRLAAAAVVAIASLAVVGGATAADRGAGARFHIDATLHLSFTGNTCAGFPGFVVAGIGSAEGTDIGQGPWVGTECVAALDTGQTVVTAADGAQLELSWVSAVLSYDPVTGLIHAVGNFTVDGGTGRFAGSTGGGTITANANILTLTTLLDLDGTIRHGHDS
jgi:hypothetical protein